ncbi:MAG: agmatinase, partial [Desulfobacterales bacterium]|nr:agmatinase [Desulfobacterales bacterium]
LGEESGFPSFEKASVVILPFPYEGGVSYGKGTREAPDAIIDASPYMEAYDEMLDTCPCEVGIVTVEPPIIPLKPEGMFETIYQNTKYLLTRNKFVIVIGGDHSITSGCFKAFHEKYKTLSCIQIDAHADLRDVYEGSRLNHACAMSRILEFTPHTLQIGIRSMSKDESIRIKRENLKVCTMHSFYHKSFDIDAAIYDLPDPVFLTIDVDAFDFSVVAATGTPEPGGFRWYEGLSLLKKIFYAKNVVGFDIVELSYSPYDKNSAFAIAKLIYKLIGFKFYRRVYAV